MSNKIVTHTELFKMGKYGRRNKVYNYLREKDCPSIKINGKWFVDLDEFNKWHKKKKIAQAEERRKERELKNANKK